MIPVTRLDGTLMIVNAEQIAWIEYVPDPVLTLVNGEKLIVREPPETIVARVKAYKRSIAAGGRPGIRRAVAALREVQSGGDV
jgi:flagellar protein FlbD